MALEVLQGVVKREGRFGVDDDDDPGGERRRGGVRVGRLEGSEILAEGALHRLALQALGGARVDVGDDAEGEETRKRAPVQILNEQDHGLLLLGMQCFALLEYGVDTGLALLLRLTLDRNADGKGGDHVLAMQHDIGQVHHGRYDLQCERKRSSAHLHRILLLVSGDAKSR